MDGSPEQRRNAKFSLLRSGEAKTLYGKRNEGRDNLEARGGIEPPIKVLQTFALPLGDRAPGTNLVESECDLK
jgi:hypothetical protein